MRDKRDITITTTDYERLRTIIWKNRLANTASPWQLTVLEQELDRARLVPPQKVPPDLVTMNSTVQIRGVGRNDSDTWTIVYPEDADLDCGRISILSPVALAVLGYRKGDEVEWEVPAGLRRYLIEDIVFQPEAAGRFDM